MSIAARRARTLGAIVLLLVGSACLAQAAPADLQGLLTQAGISYAARDRDTFEVQIRGENGNHTLIVRRVENVLGVWCTPLAVAESQVPGAVWPYLAELNAGNRMAHAGYTQGYFVVVTGHELQAITPGLLKLMVTDVAVMSDQLLPKLKEMLATE